MVLNKNNVYDNLIKIECLNYVLRKLAIGENILLDDKELVMINGLIYYKDTYQSLNHLSYEDFLTESYKIAEYKGWLKDIEKSMEFTAHIYSEVIIC